MSSKFLKVGITGGIGSGKSFIANVCEKLNYPVFYSDQQAKELINSDSYVKGQIIDLLGEKAYLNDAYNVDYVAKLIFEDPALRSELNKIVHPAVKQAFQEWVISKSQYSDILFNEAAIMIESGSYLQMDKVILVSAPLNIRMERVIARDKLDEQEVLKRIDAQSTDEFKRQFAHFEVVNDGREILPQILNIIDLIRL